MDRQARFQYDSSLGDQAKKLSTFALHSALPKMSRRKPLSKFMATASSGVAVVAMVTPGPTVGGDAPGGVGAIGGGGPGGGGGGT